MHQRRMYKQTDGQTKRNLCKITFILFECHRAIAKSLDFYLFVILKEFMITKSSILEIQNLIVNPKSLTVKSNSEQYQFLFKYISSKNH